ncbi:MAG: hypothetical protein IJX81_02765 [Clostridia bacterium]|nr:hypothetical protein [Clostridia bacterium]
MTAFEKYVFMLCLIVFVLLTAVFTTMIAVISRQQLRIIRHGVDDKKIWAEYQKEKGKKKRAGVFETIFSAIFYCAVFAVFGFSVYLNVIQDNVNGNIPVPRVVQSASMAKKYEGNKYLFKNNLNDQFDMFDIVITRQLPDQFELELYDIVVYEVDDTLIIHRIVAIEEPNEEHPNERYFRMQGDNVHVSDKFPVKYEQMKAIYVGERLPMVGSFVMFMQSPAGYLCVLLIVFAMIAMPRVEKKLEKETQKRIKFLLQKEEEDKLLAQEKKPEVRPAPCCACPLVRKRPVGVRRITPRNNHREEK